LDEGNKESMEDECMNGLYFIYSQLIGGCKMKKVLRYGLFLLLLLGVQSMVSAAVWTVSPWTDDASTGISSSKTYTHAVNFSSGPSTTVNGVAFTNAWTSFANGSFNDNRTVDFDNGNNITGDSYLLSTHFRYWGVSMILTGLTPGKVYELTFFSVAWEDGTRTVTLTHGATSFVFNQDMYGNNNGIKIVGLYTADANGELRLGMVNDFHMYAFANCVYTGTLPVVVAQVAPAAFEGGNRVGLGTVLTWAEEFSGSLTNPGFDVYMDPNEAKVTAMDPTARVSSKQSTFSFDPVLDPNALYYWRVATYTDMDNTEPNMVTAVRSFRTVYEEEHWTDSSWTNDADSEISVGKIYTHKVNFNASESASTIVNGVAFENDTNRTGLNWTLAGALGAAGGSHHVAGDGGALVQNMYFGSTPTSVLTLTGLTPGTNYVLTKYTRGWGAPGGRRVHFITSADGRTTTLDGNIDGDGYGRLFKYTYTAPSSGQLILTFNPLTSDSWHHYAFSNEVATPAYVDPIPLPGANVNADVELSWVLKGTAVSPTYNLKVATDAGMSNLVVNEIGLTSTAYTPYLSSNLPYYWQVQIVQASTVIYTSPVWNFNTTPPQPATKVIEWKFNETTGIIAEQTGPTADADGILYGFNEPNTPGVSHVAGLVNNGLRLNGQDEYVDVSNAEAYMPTSSGQPFAISGYIRTFGNYGPLFSMRNSTDEQPIIDIALGANGVEDRPGRICLLVRDDTGAASSINSGITVNDGRWHNFVVTRIEGKWTLYIDGVSHGVLNGAATGDVSLNFMGIGASLKWLADDWNNGRTYYRYFKGIVDEYTVWDGALLPSQLAELAAKVPPQGDINFDLVTDIDDLTGLAGDWLKDTLTPVQSTAVLENMESYTSDPNTFKANWAYTPEETMYGLVTSLSMVPDPDPNNLYGQVMRLDYNMNGKLHTHVPFRLLDHRVNSSLYDRLIMRIWKPAGCEVNRLILDFYDGRGNVDPVAEGMHSKGRLEVDFVPAVTDKWTIMDWTIPKTESFTTCTDLSQIMVSLQDGGVDTGYVLIDSIELVDSTTDCVPVVGEMVPDMNGDCVVNLLDFAQIAKGWLNGV
jgi:hypothetical protein